MTSESEPDRQRLNLRALLAVFLGVALSSLDAAIANTALPTFASALQVSPAASVWVINAYQLSVVATLLPIAALGDRLGARRIFLAGMMLFTAASLACALSTSLLALSVSRAVQGLGAAGMMSVNIALVRMIYPPTRLGRGVGLNAFVVGSSYALGPTVASSILAIAPWPWLFGINVPLGLFAIGFGLNSLPTSPARPQAYDWRVAGTTALVFAALIFGLGSAAQRDGLWPVLGPAVVVLAFGIPLFRHQARSSAPIVPLDLFRRPMFALSAFTAFCSFATQGLAFVSLPFYFESVLQRQAVETGFLMTPWAVVVALGAPWAGRMSDRHHPGLLGGIGLAVLSLGMASLALLKPGAHAADIVLRMCVCGIGFALYQSPNLKALMSSAPPERSSAASGVIAMVRLTGQTTGAALVALCLGLGGVAGASWALLLGVGFAALASLTSLARLKVQ